MIQCASTKSHSVTPPSPLIVAPVYADCDTFTVANGGDS